MPVFYALEDGLVQGRQLLNQESMSIGRRADPLAKGDFKDLIENANVLNKIAPDFDNFVFERAVKVDRNVNDFLKGQPLTLWVWHVYTGRYPRGTWRSERPSRDLMVLSSVKEPSVTAGAPRTLNFIANGIPSYSNVDAGDASQPGSPIMYHTPALLHDVLYVTIDLAFNDFDSGVTRAVSNIVQGAGVLPIFTPHKASLLIAGEVVRLGGQFGEAQVDLRPDIQFHDKLDLLQMNVEGARRDFILLTNDETLGENYSHFNEQGEILNGEGVKYDGHEPYVVLAIDQTERDELKDFQALAATAELMKDFLDDGTPSQKTGEIMSEAMKLYNDSHYRALVDKTRNAISKLKDQTPPPTDLDERINKLEREQERYTKHIQSDLLKPQ